MRSYFHGLVFFLLLFGNMLAQTADTCFLPLAIGNKWQYRVRTTLETMWPYTIKCRYSLKTFTITSASPQGGNLYYYTSPIGAAHYDTSTQQLYLASKSTSPLETLSSLYWDFSKPVGWSLDWRIMVQETISFFDKTENCLGKRNAYDIRMWNEALFMNQIGMVLYRNAGTAGGGTGGGLETHTLIGCILADGTVYVDSAKPTIDFVSCSSNTNSNILRLNINHKYSANDVNFDTTTSYTYIDYAKVYYYYSNGNDSTNVDSLSLVYDNMDVFSATIPKWQNPTDEYTLNYKIVATDKALIQHTTSYPETGFAKLIISSIGNEGTDLTLNSFSLNQNYPNPFNPSTTIEFNIPANGLVELKIFDVLGKEVATLFNGEKSAGTHKIEFNSNSAKHSLSSGIYFYSIKYNGVNIITKKMILAK